MRRLGLGLLLLASALAAHAEQPAEDFSAPLLKLSTVQFAHSGSYFLPAYRFSANVALARPDDNASAGLGLASGPRPFLVPQPQQEIAQPKNTGWQQISGSAPVMFPQFMRLEFKGDRYKLTLQPQSASMEGDQVKVTFRSQSVWMQWHQNFH